MVTARLGRGRAVGLVALLLLLVVSTTVPLSAHVGSPDVYFEGNAGPYRLLVAVRTPPVVPGVAEVEVRVLDAAPRQVRVVPLRLSGPGAEFAPVADRAVAAAGDPRFFTANVWMMTTGAWQVRITVDGDAGSGQVSVPVDALASRTLRLDGPRALLLLPLGLFLVFGFIAIIGASVGQAQADPGQPTPPSRIRRARIARVLAFALALIVLGLSNRWWGAEAQAYDQRIYKPLELQPRLDPDGSLQLDLHDPGWLEFRVLDDLVPDHGHTMHLFAVRTPNLDRLLHLHPRELEAGSFLQQLPAVQPGSYRLFADVVHATGLPETAVADMTVPTASGGAAGAKRANSEDGDDSIAIAPADGAFQPDRVTSELLDGSRMTWQRDPGALKAKQPYLLTFRVEDRDGQPARDLALYMGMPGHAIVLRRDLTVFAHVHPSGTVPMASLAMTAEASSSQNPHAGHMMAMSGEAAAAAAAPALPATMSFPYGFPSAGEYRLFVQVKRGAQVQTGVFDVRVQ